FERSRGNIPEPDWYAGIGALAWCYEGDRVVHEWSSGHPQYTFEETADRLRRVRQLSGPTTCAKLKSLNKLCEGCPFYDTATTPLDSVRWLAQPISSPSWHDNRASTQSPSETPVDPFVDGAALEGHAEYQYKGGALIYYEAGQNGKPISSTLSSFPVRLASIHTGEVTSGQHYYQVSHYHPHDGWKEVELRASDLHSQTMVAKLADAGVVIHDPLRFSKYIRDSADVIRKREKTGMAFEQFGWKDNDSAFLYGDRLYASESR